MNNEFTNTELANEQWRDVEGYDGMYQVSDLGRVRSLKYGKVRVLRAGTNSAGYLMVILCKDGNEKNYRVHRLVAQAFIENTDSSKTYINHRDENKQNNRVDNLEWCTASYNASYNGIRRRCMEHNCKLYKIKPLYRPDLTYAQNIEIFKSNGIDCSKETIKRLRRELGLTKTKPKQIE